MKTRNRLTHRAERNTPVRLMGMAGWACYGLIHLVIAWLAVEVAFGRPQEQPAPQGAIAKIAQQPVGTALLALLAAGLIAFALSQFAMAAIGFDWVRGRGTRIARKLGALGRAVLSLGLGVLAARQFTGVQVGSSSAQQKQFTAGVLELPAGRIFVGLLAAVVLVVAVATIRRGLIKSFLEDLDLSGMSARAKAWIKRCGVIGWVAKGVAYASIGVLFAAAAVSRDARQSGGLDQALHLLAANDPGKVALGLIAFGFVAFAIFCFAAARTHRR
ncbi:protein of unknown function [Saccharopolyspora antimicrobica]|uniref:Uncharacterized protein DUF1206 n=1 Tax=Saccharopolyspora antimicrobica TaxID=455193 RepID=A0A1I5KVI8_9PSEU|nr:DUF1206 domain-containing protein [Saccharopolyspora antimicrobica]RKT89122.1 uncharacterized protein DUF1206 [Saccharopolyspora antimicrobica]SFO88646.1 protein of unknown function [Saccharopolyspora antimicrobica]